MNTLSLLLALLSAPAAVESERFVYLSAVEGHDARGVLAELDRRLQAQQLRLKDAVSANLYLREPEDLASLESVWAKAFGNMPPARTVLPAKMAGDTRVAVSLIAWRGRKRFIRGGAVLAGDTLFLPGLTAEGRGPIEEQTRSVMRQQEAILQAAGLAFADLTMTRIYLSDPKDYAGLNQVYREFVTAPPPARATVNARAIREGQRLQVQSVAVRGSGKGRPSGEGITSPIHSYSVKAGARLYVTGMTGRRADGSFAKGDARSQAGTSLATIEEQLRGYGFAFRDVVDTLVWLRNPEDWPSVRIAYDARLTGAQPALTVVGIPPSSPDALVEIAVVAVRRQ